MVRLREILLGPSYFYHRGLVRRSHFWSKAEVEKYILSRKKTLKYWARGKKVFSKEDYRDNLNRFENRYLHILTKKVSTGGTSGQPFEFYMDGWFRRQKERAYLFDIWSSVGYRPFDLRVVFRGNFSDKLIEYRALENVCFISPNRLGLENRDYLYSFLSRLDPFYLHVYPSSLFTLIEFLGERKFAKLNIKGVLAGSECFPLEQMKIIREQYGLPIAHWYGHSEYAVLAKYCNSCNGFHFYPTYGLVDFRWVSGNVYEILASSYNLIGTRFIRYKTEDLAVINETRCGCCNFTRVDSILGRQQDFFVDRQGNRHAFGPYLFGIHNQFWHNVGDVQFIQKTPGHMKVLIVPNGRTAKGWVENFLTSRFSVVDLKFDYVEEIGKTERGKHKYFVGLSE